MKRLIPLSLLAAAVLAAYPAGQRIPAGNSGEPGTGTPCGSCHSVSLNPSAGRVTLTLPGGNTFTPGTAQRWSVSVTDSNASFRKGFQLTAAAGTLAAVTSAVVNNSGAKPYASHSASASSWSVDWTPPANADSVTVWVAGFAGSGTRQGNVYTTSVTLTKSAVQASEKPAIADLGVVNAGSFAPGIAPGAWLTIFGTNLAPAGVARSWSQAEVASGTLPLALEGTSVRINGKPAAVAYVSEKQLNVQAPADDSRGTVTVEVTAAAGTSVPATATLSSALPGLFRFQQGAYRYAAAVHADGSLAGPPDVLGSGAVPARPGETLLLFGTGFGATTPAVAPGTAFSGSAPLAEGNNLAIRIGGVAAEVRFAGLSAPGLYQFNVVVPALADGDHAVEVAAWGVPVPAQQYIAVKQ